MKLIEVAQRIDRSKQNESYVDTEDMGTLFSLNVPYVDQERLKAYWIGNWYCTDTYVGYRMYFLDDEPVAFSFQLGRKSDEEFKWFSEELAMKVRDHLLTLMEEEDYKPALSFCDPESDIGESFKISFSGQILNSGNVTYRGEKAVIIERIKHTSMRIDTLLNIQLPDGQIKQVEIEDVDFGFHLK